MQMSNNKRPLSGSPYDKDHDMFGSVLGLICGNLEIPIGLLYHSLKILYPSFSCADVHEPI